MLKSRRFLVDYLHCRTFRLTTPPPTILSPKVEPGQEKSSGRGWRGTRDNVSTVV